jgi:hypothetical protein
MDILTVILESTRRAIAEGNPIIYNHEASGLCQVIRSGLEAADIVLGGIHPPGYGSDACDLSANTAQDTWFIEVKKGWYGKGPGWINKPREQLEKWVRDLWKLSRIQGSVARRLFVLVFFLQQGQPDAMAGTLHEIAAAEIVDHLQNAGRFPHLPASLPRVRHGEALPLLRHVMASLGEVRSLAPIRSQGYDHYIVVGAF